MNLKQCTFPQWKTQTPKIKRISSFYSDISELPTISEHPNTDQYQCMNISYDELC